MIYTFNGYCLYIKKMPWRKIEALTLPEAKTLKAEFILYQKTQSEVCPNCCFERHCQRCCSPDLKIKRIMTGGGI